MGDTRVTQEAALVAGTDDGSGEYRVTSSVVHALYVTLPPINVTQVATLALTAARPCISQRVQCWKITRLDGQVFAYTAHDEPVDYNGTTYSPCDSLKATAVSGGVEAGADAGDVEITGIISDTGITEEDLAGGIFDGATVEIYLVPFDRESVDGVTPKTDQISTRLTKGIISKIQHTPRQYVATVNTPGAKLTQQALLKAYTPACRWTLGSPQCGVVLDSSDAAIGSVTSVPARNAAASITHRAFSDSTRMEATDYFTFGKLTWTSGANTGIEATVKTFGYSDFELWDIMPNEIQVGDGYEVMPGCNKTSTDCSTKFNNLINFGGFPKIPGKDSIYETPDIK